MRTIHARRYLIMALLSIIILLPLLVVDRIDLSETEGRLYISRDSEKTLYIEKYDLRLNGSIINGITYFFLPSYVKLIYIDMSDSPEKIYLDDGNLLTRPALGVVQAVTAKDDNGTRRAMKICFMQSENLHTLFLNFDTDNYEISHDSYSRVSLTAISPRGEIVVKDGDTLIKGRGNATWDLDGVSPKKLPYELKFSKAYSIGEVSPRKKWVLLANAYEGTGILNKMVFDTAAKIGMPYVTESDWVDLYINDQYSGNYLICSEPQKSAEKVVDAGGCIIEKNDVYFEDKAYGFYTSHDAFTIKAPDPIDDNLFANVEKLTDTVDFDLNLDSPNMDHIDIDSFARWYLLEEFFFNEDALITSCYFYTDRETKQLFAGPPWDFDGTCGESFNSYLDFRGSILEEDENRLPLKWYNSLYFNSPEYRAYLYNVFVENADILTDLILADIDAYYDKIATSMKMNAVLYGRAGYGPDYTIPGYYDDVANNVRYTKYYLYNRLLYLSELWHVQLSMPELDFSDGTYHSVIFLCPDGTEVVQTVPDGTMLTEVDPPSLDTELYDRWIYTANGATASAYIPVYEDIYLSPGNLIED